MTTYTLQGILKLAGLNCWEALVAARDQFGRADAGFREATYNLIAVAFVYARILRSCAKEAKRFGQDPFWEGDPPDFAFDTLFHVLRWLYNGLHKGANYERARCHARAMEAAFEDGLDAAEVKAHIEENGGLDKMKDDASLERKAGVQRVESDIGDESPDAGDDEDQAPDARRLDPQTKAVRAERPIASGTKTTSPRKLTIEELLAEYLLVKPDPADLEAMTTDATQTGDEYWLRIQRGPRNDAGLVDWFARRFWKSIRLDQRSRRLRRAAEGGRAPGED